MSQQMPDEPTPQPPAAYTYYPAGGVPSLGYPAPPTSVPSKSMAVIALVCAILGILVFTWIAAVVLAIMVLSQPKAGKGLAVAALTVCGLWLVAAFVAMVALVLAGEADRNGSGEVIEGGRVDVTDVRVGDCVADDDLAGEDRYTINVVPCSESHRYETYANFELPAGDFPGDDKVRPLAEDGCTGQRFEAYVGLGYADSELDVTVLRPMDHSWHFDRGVTCMLTEHKTTTGSLKGAER